MYVYILLYEYVIYVLLKINLAYCRAILATFRKEKCDSNSWNWPVTDSKIHTFPYALI